MTEKEFTRLRIEMALIEALRIKIAFYTLSVAIEESRAELVDSVITLTPPEQQTAWRDAAAAAISNAKRK